MITGIKNRFLFPQIAHSLIAHKPRVQMFSDEARYVAGDGLLWKFIKLMMLRAQLK